MGEGTKLGEFKDTDDFNHLHATEKPVASGNSESQGTKLGQLSEFELSLLSPEERVAAAKSTALADDASLFEAHLDSGVANFSEGDVVKGVVRSIEKAGVLVDIGYKSDGFILNSEFSSDPSESPANSVSPGEEIYSLILKLETKDGYTMLSRKRAEYAITWNYLGDVSKDREPVDVKVKSKVEGGLVAEYKGIKGFIPASHILNGANDDADNYINKTVPVIVLQADRKRRKVIFSAKLARQKAAKGDVSKILDSLEVGQTRSGRVSSIKEFGAFVDLGGVEGLVHISELSWSRVAHPSDLVSVGQDVQVFILGIDRETGRISLGMKQLQPDPWVSVAERYQVGQVVNGTVTRVTSFGAFVQIEQNLEGLIHISELSSGHVKRVEDVLKPGDSVEAKVIKVLPDEQRIGLSLKALQTESEGRTEANTEEAVEV